MVLYWVASEGVEGSQIGEDSGNCHSRTYSRSGGTQCTRLHVTGMLPQCICIRIRICVLWKGPLGGLKHAQSTHENGRYKKEREREAHWIWLAVT